jgi:hypothetical protein
MQIEIAKKINLTTKHIIQLLVQAKYGEIESLSKGIRLKAEEMETTIREYGRHLTMPPESQFTSIDVIEIIGSKPRAWSVRFDLWTEEEGRSDLSIELTLIEDSGPLLRVEVDSLHVL